MMRFAKFSALWIVVTLAGCGFADRMRDKILPADAGTVAQTSNLTGPGTVAAKSVEAMDTTSAVERTRAMSAGPVGGEELGRVRVTLGNPAEAGFWLRSTLVTIPTPGRVVSVEGATVAVTLLPGTGGAQLSLAAFRALGLPLTELPEVLVTKA